MTENETFNESVNHFLINWSSFPIDYWWRKRYNIPFGSKEHREMNFIDMYIEWKEDLNMNKSITEYDFDIENNSDDIVSQQEIDDDYNNLDLSNFDKNNGKHNS